MTWETRNTGASRPDKRLRWAGRILFAVAIFAITDLALQPGHEMPASMLGSDKLEHFAAFAVLAVLARIAWPGLTHLFSVPALMLYGLGIEIAQATLTTGRTASMADFAADVLGIASGMLAAWLLRSRT